MKYIILVFLGSGIGGVLRHTTNIALFKVAQLVNFPLQTIFVNIIGSFVMGLLISLLTLLPPKFYLLDYFLLVGVLGGFTTFASFSLDALHLLQNKEIIKFIIYVLASTIISILLISIGYYLGRLLTKN